MFELTATSIAAQPILAAASACLGHDVVRWVRGASAGELQRNAAAQLLCCTQALAAWASLALHPRDEIVVAGYSVGELASWGCAGVLQPADVLRLAGLRAQAMDAAGGADTSLVAVRGLARERLVSLCGEYGCEIAIVLADDQFIVGGSRAELETLSQRALTSGAQRVTRVPVAIASHTSRLAPASAAFLGALQATTVTDVSRGIRLLSGIDGDHVSDVRSGIDKLARQISQTLDWQACLRACAEAGVTQVLELGPGRALAAMAREAIPDARCRSLEEFRTLEGLRAWLT